uniref:ATP binding cassette subfamily B member 6 (LAN blood group) n=1 Tax=Chrysemys picta bellii TaxID=8478 RepID=A0A8C3HGX5_CHRPI
MVVLGSYCPGNGTISQPWTQQGFSPCFYFTLVPTVLLSVCLLLGALQYACYARFGRAMEPKHIPRSRLYHGQVLLSLLLAVQPLGALLWQALDAGPLYGYALLYGCLSAVGWGCALGLLQLEHTRVLAQDRTRGHGTVLLLFWALAFAAENLALVSWRSPLWWWSLGDAPQKVQFSLWVLRYVCTFTLFVLGMKAPGLPHKPYMLLVNEDERDVENRQVGPPVPRRCRGGCRGARGVTTTGQCWVIAPAGTLACPLAGDAINELTEGTAWHTVAWTICTYVFLKFLQGGGAGSTGFVSNLRTFLWIRVQQFTNREVQVRLFAHLHGLSLRWHLGRKTGEVLRSVDRGTSSVNSLLSYIIFSIFPTIADIVIGIIYFSSAFSLWFGLIIFVCMGLYLTSLTIIITEWRTKYRRDMNSRDNEAKARAVDSLLNFETVKYYNAESYEVNRFNDAILKYQVSEWKVNASLALLNQTQNLIIGLGLLAGSLLCAYFVTEKRFQVGDFVLFGTYIIQLYTPLNWFGTYYRMIQSSFIDMENMFELFNEEQEVKDEVNAGDLRFRSGRIEFENVHFSYMDGPYGVGPSGSGKSTIIRLLFRFYDVWGGCIRIDGQDIAKVGGSAGGTWGRVQGGTHLTLPVGSLTGGGDSGKPCHAAADRCLACSPLPRGRPVQKGLQYSVAPGGYRVAPHPLPHAVPGTQATSALDTETERNIQGSLAKVCANRTTIVVAHRLSTIVNADQILVLKDGRIVERGRHEELLQKGGVYAGMWQQQQAGDTSDSDTESKDRSSEKLPAAPRKGP